MGRHTLHVDAEAKVSHYVCDYTGIPMKGPGCFMPFWKTPTSRMTKRGNYCCWEAVLQHARATADRDILPKVESYVAEETHHMIGPLHLTASDLTHLGGTILMEHWLDGLWTPAKDVPAMLVKQDGRVLPVTVMCIDGRYKFQYWINTAITRGPFTRTACATAPSTARRWLCTQARTPRWSTQLPHPWPATTCVGTPSLLLIRQYTNYYPTHRAGLGESPSAAA